MEQSVYTFKASPYSSHAQVLRLFPSPGSSGDRVLDLGCGDGHLARILAARGYRVTGVERAGGYSRAFPENVELIEADLANGLPALKDRFDHVLCADILEHLPCPEELLREVHQVLAPGGRLIASLPNSGNIYFRANVLLGRFPKHEKGLFDRTHLHFYVWSGWRHLLSRCGFTIYSIEVSGIPVGLTVPAALGESAPVRLAEGLFYGLARLRKTLFAYQFIVVAHAQR